MVSLSLLGGLLLALLVCLALSAPVSTVPGNSPPSPSPSPLPTSSVPAPGQAQPEFCEEFLALQLSQLQRKGSDAPTTLQLGDILVSVRRDGGRGKRAAVDPQSVQGVRWPNATIPYVFSSEIHQIYRNNFISAMEQWEMRTCIKFVEQTTEADYVEMTEALSCASYIGRRGGKQVVSIGPNCGAVGNALHELGHVIGFAHEHSRPDRDNYVTVLWDNVDRSFRANFCKFKAADINSFGVGYDYKSVMHYSTMAFSVNGHPTIEPRDPSVTIGQRTNISRKDAVQANKMYRCTAVGPATTNTTNSTETTNSTSTIAPTNPLPTSSVLVSGDYIALQLTSNGKYVVCLGGGVGCVPTTCVSPGRCGNDEFQLLKDPASPTKDRFIRAGDRVALGMGPRQRIQCSAEQCREISCSSSFPSMVHHCRTYMYEVWSPHRTRGEIIQNRDRIFLRSGSDRSKAVSCSKKRCQMRARTCTSGKDTCNPIAQFRAVKISM